MAEKRLKIIQMLPELNSGGVERGTLEIGKYLANKGHTSIVISEGGRLVDELEKEGSRHIKLRVASKSPLTIASSFALKKILEEERPDILHLRSRVPAWVAYLALKMMDSAKRPAVVTTFHGFHSVNPYSAIMASGDIVIAVSRIISEHIVECYGTKRNIRIIPRGSDVSYFSCESVSDERKDFVRKQWRINDAKKPLIILPARFTRLKGHDLFINALSKIKEIPWTAVFVGDHHENLSYVNELTELAAKYGIKDRLIFGGFVSDMPAALSICDMVVSSSVRPESFGRTAVEAMSMGKPVIVPRIGGFEETVSDGVTGLLYRAGDAFSLSECMSQMLSSFEIRNKMGMEGRKRVKRYFTLDRMCKKTEEAYFEAFSKKMKKNG